jgi:hypothetical protein
MENWKPLRIIAKRRRAMSDNSIILIPEDPHHVPAKSKQKQAFAKFCGIAPDADEIKIIVSETRQFFDCGENFERILCPACRTEVPVHWWQERMIEELRLGNPLHKQAMPCCGARYTMHELIYEWPQGFGRFGLEAMNPNIRKLKPEHQRELEAILGCPLRIIYQHI